MSDQANIKASDIETGDYITFNYPVGRYESQILTRPVIDKSHCNFPRVMIHECLYTVFPFEVESISNRDT